MYIIFSVLTDCRALLSVIVWFSSFSRVGFVLPGQESQDVMFGDNNFLFFLSGNDTGKFVIATSL